MTVAPNDITAMVSCEPGGAEILSSLALESNRDFRFALEGPALGIFERKLGYALPNLSLESLLEELTLDDCVLTGTSYEPDLERRTIAACRGRGIRCATFLDHYVNYRLRFADDFPDSIWVGDRFALERAVQAGLPEDKLLLVPNPHYAHIQRRLRSMNRDSDADRVGKRILYLCEPVSMDARARFGDPNAFGFTEETLVVDLLDTLSRISRPVSEVRVRPHPIENQSKYDALLAAPRDFPVNRSMKIDYLEEIVWADLVIGVETIALLYATFAGKRAVSVIPTDRYRCSLPQPEIMRLLRFAEIEAYL